MIFKVIAFLAAAIPIFLFVRSTPCDSVYRARPSSSAISRCFGWLGALPSVSPNLDRTPATVANLAPSCLATRLLTTFGVSRRCCFSNVTSGQNAGARIIRVRRLELGHYPRAPTEAALPGPVVDGDGSLALGRRLRPSARKLDQDLFLFFGFGLADPTHRFLGILPELISL